MPKEDTWKSDRKRVPYLLSVFFSESTRFVWLCASLIGLCVCVCVCVCARARARLCTCIVCSNTKKREREREHANAILINASRRSSIVVEKHLLKIQPFYVIYLILLLLIRFFFFFFEIFIFGIFLEFLGILIFIVLSFWKFLSLDSLSLE